MRFTISPKGMTSEAWLEANKVSKADMPPLTHRSGANIAVVLVDTAGGPAIAAVQHSPNELRKYTDPADLRKKTWYQVPLAKVEQVLDDPRFTPYE